MPMSRINYEEKRDHRRMRIDCRVLFKGVKEADRHEARGVDLSASGVLFETDQYLNEKDLLVLSVLPERPLLPTLDALVEVVRVDAITEGRYRIGAKIRKCH